MWKHLFIGILLICHFTTYSQNVSENLLAGNWLVVRWETQDRLLDFQDTAASVKFMVDNFKQKNKVQTIPKDDSVHIRQEVTRILTAAGAIRFRISLNKDKTFTWTGNGNNNAQYKGTYALANSNNELVLTSFDGATKAYRTMALKLHALQPNQMIIEIPSEEPGFKQSKFTLRRQ
jgi:hypothetical protein